MGWKGGWDDELVRFSCVSFVCQSIEILEIQLPKRCLCVNISYNILQSHQNILFCLIVECNRGSCSFSGWRVLALEVSEMDRVDRGVVRPMLLKGW